MTNKKTGNILDTTIKDVFAEVVDGKVSSLKGDQLPDALEIVFHAINSTVGGILITDKAGQIRFVNPSFLALFDYENSNEILGTDAAELFATNEVKKFSDVKAIIDTVKCETEEFTVVNKSGNSFMVEVQSSNVKNSDGEVIGRMASFVDVTERKNIEQDRERLISKLQDALNHIKTLRGIIPICASCKQIRDDKGFWHQVEVYVRDHSEANFSHSICPKCAKSLYPDLEIYKDDPQAK